MKKLIIIAPWLCPPSLSLGKSHSYTAFAEHLEVLIMGDGFADYASHSSLFIPAFSRGLESDDDYGLS